MFGFKSLVNERVFWNTGCLYTEHGQRMGAYWDGTYIHYVDVDRMIDGSIRCSNVDGEYTLKHRAMLAYDNGLGHRHTLLSCEGRDALEAETVEKAPSLKKESN